VLGRDHWDVVKSIMRGHDVRGTDFDIPPNRLRGKLIKLLKIKLEVATPYVYDIFIKV